MLKNIIIITNNKIFHYQNNIILSIIYIKNSLLNNFIIMILFKSFTIKYKTSCLITKKIKELINKENKLLYSIPYQHFTNCIENYFSIFKSKMKIRRIKTQNKR